MRRAGRMALSLPAGGRGHWQRSLMDGGDAPVSRLLSLCKPIPCSYCFKYPFPAARLSSARSGRVAPFQLCLCGRRADRGGASVRRGVGRRGRGVDRRGRARGCARFVRARVLGAAAAARARARGDRVRLARRRVRGLDRPDRGLVGPAGSLLGLLQPGARVLRVRGGRRVRGLGALDPGRRVAARRRSSLSRACGPWPGRPCPRCTRTTGGWLGFGLRSGTGTRSRW